MLINHRVQSASRVQCTHNCIRTRGIAQCHRNVAQPAPVADASYRGTFGFFEECLFIPQKQLNQFRRIELMARNKVIFLARL